jgi:hypothetical protein
MPSMQLEMYICRWLSGMGKDDRTPRSALQARL